MYLVHFEDGSTLETYTVPEMNSTIIAVVQIETIERDIITRGKNSEHNVFIRLTNGKMYKFPCLYDSMLMYSVEEGVYVFRCFNDEKYDKYSQIQAKFNKQYISVCCPLKHVNTEGLTFSSLGRKPGRLPW